MRFGISEQLHQVSPAASSHRMSRGTDPLFGTDGFQCSGSTWCGLSQMLRQQVLRQLSHLGNKSLVWSFHIWSPGLVLMTHGRVRPAERPMISTVIPPRAPQKPDAREKSTHQPRKYMAQEDTVLISPLLPACFYRCSYVLIQSLTIHGVESSKLANGRLLKQLSPTWGQVCFVEARCRCWVDIRSWKPK